ncbi:MAG: hypothetical protein M5U33_00240 [Pseudorhodoplanes sp.]|nr:hypothetical protein [Pseudorhodoplanes sp.]
MLREIALDPRCDRPDGLVGNAAQGGRDLRQPRCQPVVLRMDAGDTGREQEVAAARGQRKRRTQMIDGRD